LLKLCLRGCQRFTAWLTTGVNEVNTQQTSYLPIEIYFTTLDTLAKKRAGTNINDPSSQTQTVGLDKASDTDVVTDFHLFHDSLFQDKLSGGNQGLSPVGPFRQRIFSVLAEIRPLHRFTTPPSAQLSKKAYEGCMPFPIDRDTVH
jgi:hypothetical protein